MISVDEAQKKQMLMTVLSGVLTIVVALAGILGVNAWVVQPQVATQVAQTVQQIAAQGVLPESLGTEIEVAAPGEGRALGQAVTGRELQALVVTKRAEVKGPTWLDLTYAKRDFAAKTAGYTILADQRGAIFSNLGATGALTLTLPTAAKGLNFCFYTGAAQTLYIDPAGTNQISHLTNAGGDRISNATAGDSVCLVGISTSAWIPLGEVGTWADAN
jgi:hypothetical protein